MRSKCASDRNRHTMRRPGIWSRSVGVAVIAIGAAAYLVPIRLSMAGEAAPAGDAPGGEALIKALPAGQSAGAAAACPAGSRVIAGGVGTTGSVTTGLDYTVELSGPLDETGATVNTDDGDIAAFWYASVHNSSGGPQDFKVFAVCVPHPPGSLSNTVQAELINDLPSGQSAGAAAGCPPGQRAINGGVGTTGPVTDGLDYTVELSGPLDETGATANTDDGDRTALWYASVHNTSGSPQDFKVFAICNPGATGASIQAEPINDLPSGQSAAAAGACPPGERLFAGGVGTTGPASAGLDYTVELSGPLDETGAAANTDDGDIVASWYASVHNTSGSPQDFKVFAVCGGGDFRIQAEPLNDVPSTKPSAVPCAGRTATIVGTSGADTLTGTSNADVIAGLGGNDILKGLGAKDRICGGSGKDTIRGGGGADFLTGGPGADRILGGSGRDRITGGRGKDQCSGGPGVDQVSGC